MLLLQPEPETVYPKYENESKWQTGLTSAHENHQQPWVASLVPRESLIKKIDVREGSVQLIGWKQEHNGIGTQGTVKWARQNAEMLN